MDITVRTHRSRLRSDSPLMKYNKDFNYLSVTFKGIAFEKCKHFMFTFLIDIGEISVIKCKSKFQKHLHRQQMLR